ncbi:LysR substrate-binding domain-containing protein [Myxococcus sp. SDU36]|uniref:LysR substrate-binding domain-containing protein n=1 Tax=Myxococcus sp. SDU36 TaxID=2831967 RepID=UPI002543074A|nr:LysR substrate-binding domain-containing protein [Myxococcus sp. SDU36]
MGGTLRIHASGHVLRHLPPAWLRKLQAKRPDIEVALFESKTPALDVLRSGDTDLVVDHPPAVPDDVETREVGRTHPFLVLPAHHPQAKRPRVRLEQLRDDAFIAYSTDRYSRPRCRWRPGAEPPRALERQRGPVPAWKVGRGAPEVLAQLRAGAQPWYWCTAMMG